MTIGQVVYNDVAIEKALVLALRRLASPGSQTVPRSVLREHLLNMGMETLNSIQYSSSIKFGVS